MLKKMKNDSLHVIVSLSVTIAFIVFFQQDWVPEWIQQNIPLVPQGQVLAYTAYGGAWLFVLTSKILTKPPQKIELMLSNILIVGGTALKTYATIFIDLVAITVTTFTFFNVGYDLGGDYVFHLSTICGLFVFPALSLFISWSFSKQKIRYVAPIFANKPRNFSFC